MKPLKTKRLTYNLLMLLIPLFIFSSGLFLGLNLPIAPYDVHQYRKTIRWKYLHRDCTFFLLNNISSIILILLGVLSMGTITISNLFANGLELGFDISEALFSGLSPSEVIMLVAPHGSLEILGFVLAGSAGIRIPAGILLYLLKKRDYPIKLDDLKFCYKAASISLILIVIAACIEANITIWIAEDILRRHTG